jgi:hypothetical protein
MSEVPSEVRHYWRRSKAPFLNLSDLDADALDATIAALGAERRDGASRRAFGRRYMDLRRRTEAKMRQLFIEAGGHPERAAPHYFVLGESRWFLDLADDTQELVIPLAELPEDVTSFTYPDSFTAMGLAPDYGLPYEPKPYHEQVFPISCLPDVVNDHGLPEDSGDAYEGYEHRPFEQYIEVQLWSDAPVARWLDPIRR